MIAILRGLSDPTEAQSSLLIGAGLVVQKAAAFNLLACIEVIESASFTGFYSVGQTINLYRLRILFDNFGPF